MPSKPANRRVDHPAAPPEASSERVYEDSGYLWVDGSNSTDVSYHATGAYYQIYERLRARHPQLLLELCIEYYSARLGRGVLYAFRGSAPDQPAHRFRLHGLTPGSRYALKFQDQGAAANRVATGQVLMQQGVVVTLKRPLSSELVFFEQIAFSGTPPGLTARTPSM